CRPKVAWDIVTLPKKQGGLGLLPVEKQAQAIFAQFTTKTLSQRNPPWWATAAQWALDKRLGQKNMHSSDLLAAAPPKRFPKGLPAFWDRVLRSWFAIQGKGPDGTFNGDVDSMLGLPFEHPAVYLLVDITAAARKKLRENKLFTLGDVFERYEPTGAAISRDDPLLRPYVSAFTKFKINLHPHVTRKLLDYPAEPNRRTVWAHARVGTSPLEAYSPRQGRLAAASSEVAPVRLDKWERGQRHNQGAREIAQIEKISKARWARLPKIPLETKHLSLLWLMAHAAVPTAAQLSHYIPDLEPVCKYCSAVIQTSDASNDPEILESENIAHYFWACPRVRDFWQRVSRFLQDIRENTAGPAFQVDLRMYLE
ncbi:hypothetical protein IWW57_006320, partial [Coemansia sp. S610]